MKYRNCMIAYNHGGRIVVGPHPDRSGWSDAYDSVVGSCFLKAKKASEKDNLIQLLLEFHHAVVRDRVPVKQGGVITLAAHNIGLLSPRATLGDTRVDRVTESFLAEFVKANELERLSPDKQFENFAAFVTVRRHYTGETFDTTEIHMGGGGDTALDSIAIIVNGSLVTDAEALSEHIEVSGNLDVTFIFVQAERSPHFDGKKLSDFGFGVKDFFDPHPKLTRNVSIKQAAKIMEVLYENGTKFKGNPICRMYYATTGTWNGDGDLENRRLSVEADLRSLKIFRDVSFDCVGAEGIQQFYRQTKNAVVREFTFTHRTLLPEIMGVSEAYIGYIPLSELFSIVTDDNGELLGSIFFENVRDWQDYTADVNKEIRETVQSAHKDRFVIMNNGITMITKTLRPTRRDRFQIEDFQIVNGCQTTHVLLEREKRRCAFDSVANSGDGG